MTDIRWLYVTASSTEEALTIGRALVEELLCACINVLPGMQSIYRWQGKIEEGLEAVLIVKTHAALVGQVTERIKALHSYSCPCVLALKVDGGNSAYLDWLLQETQS